MHALEKSDCAVVPVKQPNKEGQPSAEAVEGRAQTKENIVQSRMHPTQSGNCMSQGMGGVRQAVLPPLIHGKSRMRKRARTDLCGGRSVMVVPTATVACDKDSRLVTRSRLVGRNGLSNAERAQSCRILHRSPTFACIKFPTQATHRVFALA